MPAMEKGKKTGKKSPFFLMIKLYLIMSGSQKKKGHAIHFTIEGIASGLSLIHI